MWLQRFDLQIILTHCVLLFEQEKGWGLESGWYCSHTHKQKVVGKVCFLCRKSWSSSSWWQDNCVLVDGQGYITCPYYLHIPQYKGHFRTRDMNSKNSWLYAAKEAVMVAHFGNFGLKGLEFLQLNLTKFKNLTFRLWCHGF